MECIPFSIGTYELLDQFGLGSPFLKLSNAHDCSLNIARIESRDSHLSMVGPVSGCGEQRDRISSR